MNFFIIYLVGGEGLDCSFMGICCEIWSPLGCLYFNGEVSQVRKDLDPLFLFIKRLDNF